jgi:nucleotide-binding universal stress UspA family protein
LHTRADEACFKGVMLMIKRILVGLGGTDYTVAAINHAVALAIAHDAELTGVSVIDPARVAPVMAMPIGDGPIAYAETGSFMAKARERVEWATQEFSKACQGASVRHRIIREVGEPFSLMTAEARYHDLMIFGLKSLFESDLVADPHDALVRLVQSGVRPLLAVSKVIAPIRKVLIAYSGSMESAKAMKRFVEMQLWPGTELRIISFEVGKGHARDLLSDAASYCRAHGLAVETECISGSPKDHLLAYMRNWGADLTVVGNSAQNLILRRIFGETALNVIRNADQPLFLAQ